MVVDASMLQPLRTVPPAAIYVATSVMLLLFDLVVVVTDETFLLLLIMTLRRPLFFVCGRIGLTDFVERRLLVLVVSSITIDMTPGPVQANNVSDIAVL